LQLDLFGQGVHGNKARKLLFLSQLEQDTLPDLFVSYGGLQVIARTVSPALSFPSYE
jgi:1-aminocyclopropane-1-carboxylate deaminase/D-cysteine desulfhydrase-like pyridoxal-dependent ACC family enzyme